MPVPYLHVVFALSEGMADIAYQNKAVVYDLLLKTAAETLITIAADPKHLGARIGLTAVLHTWGPALAHHPHAQSSSPAAASLLMVSPGLPAGPASFCPSGAYPTRRRQAGTATAPKILTNTASGTLVLAAAGA